ncbi:hypothetical protein [Streptomyces sp. SID13726]|uniref:hypothetical protein n=1 Tax=Streptomyces sp. SID13726 TaxID=2706058 RepID=UPI0013B5F837|nr:hypothetical protein [Streptomyces sp. SID13726]NEB04506.1 hypothetical protein [Streptomyces sp. SID13726]
MYLVYQPEGSEEPKRFKYNPRKLMSPEREMLERKTDRDFSDFTSAVLSGNSLCRRALLYMFLKREHPGIRWDDVDFAWDELKLEYSKQELLKMREAVSENTTGDERAATLASLDEQIATAIDESEEEGKADLPIAG